jgi:hypothetical protein
MRTERKIGREVDIDKPCPIMESAKLRFLTSYVTALKLVKKSTNGIIPTQLESLTRVREDFNKKLYPDSPKRKDSLDDEITLVESEINRILKNPFQTERAITKPNDKSIESIELDFSTKANSVLKLELSDLVKKFNVIIPKEQQLSVNGLFVKSQELHYRNFEYMDSYKFKGTNENEEFSITVSREPIKPEDMKALLGVWDNKENLASETNLTNTEDVKAANAGAHPGSKYRKNLPCNLTRTTVTTGQGREQKKLNLYSHSDLSPEKQHFPSLKGKKLNDRMQAITTQNNEAVFLKAMEMIVDPESKQYTSVESDQSQDKVFCTTSFLSNTIEQHMTDLKQTAIKTIRGKLIELGLQEEKMP